MTARVLSKAVVKRQKNNRMKGSVKKLLIKERKVSVKI